tara:strand:+ start:19899 stop:20765 length:867 start_codon:yes stop_codon:yes gene_type:complete
LFGQKQATVYLDKTDSTKNYYKIIYPPNASWIGYMVVLPGFGETADRVLEQSDLPIAAAKNGLLTIIPILQDGVLSLGIDDISQASLENILLDVRNKHQLHDQKFYIGGYSIGGSCAIKYAQESKVKPTAVFAVDPPLDFERFYHSALRSIRLTTDGNYNQEFVYMKARLDDLMGGSPFENIKKYYSISPYSFTDTTQSAVKKLLNQPILIYTELEVEWWLKERQIDASSLNFVECSAFINELNLLGNSNAILKTTYKKGYRQPDNMRHPHSWSIVNIPELLNWLQAN